MTEGVDGGNTKKKVVDRIEKCSDGDQRQINSEIRVTSMFRPEVEETRVANVPVGRRGKSAGRGGEANLGSWSVIASQDVSNIVARLARANLCRG